MKNSFLKSVFLSGSLLAGSLVFSATTSAAMGDMGLCHPTKNDFTGSQIETTPNRWEMKRSPNTGGANAGHDMLVPDDRVVVQWEVNQTSCNERCTGPVQILHFQDRGPIRIPDGVTAGVRWKKDLSLTGPGGIYSGNVTMLHVSFSDWKKVFVDKYFDCVQ
ncbi:MAG: hypothetical protein QX189_18355 [Methylococcales bacterium]